MTAAGSEPLYEVPYDNAHETTVLDDILIILVVPGITFIGFNSVLLKVTTQFAEINEDQSGCQFASPDGVIGATALEIVDVDGILFTPDNPVNSETVAYLVFMLCAVVNGVINFVLFDPFSASVCDAITAEIVGFPYTPSPNWTSI